VSLTVHGFPSLHPVPFALFSTPQTPLVHVARWHWFAGTGQSFAVAHGTQPWICVPAQTPFVHWSPEVHGLVSSQLVPFALFCGAQTPAPLQTSS
jgi:hypothetical protein